MAERGPFCVLPAMLTVCNYTMVGLCEPNGKAQHSIWKLPISQRPGCCIRMESQFSSCLQSGYPPSVDSEVSGVFTSHIGLITMTQGWQRPPPHIVFIQNVTIRFPKVFRLDIFGLEQTLQQLWCLTAIPPWNKYLISTFSNVCTKHTKHGYLSIYR